MIKLINEFHADKNSYQHLRLSLFHAFGSQRTGKAGPRDGSTGPRRGGRGTERGVARGVGVLVFYLKICDELDTL